MAVRPIRLKCFFAAWIFGWVTAIFVPSAAIAWAGLSPLAEGRDFGPAILAIADEVSPAAKIGFGVIFACLMFAMKRLAGSHGWAAVAVNMLLAAAAMLMVLAILPADWSRGFGVGLAGVRFASLPTTIYVVGALLAGLVFSVSEAKCSARATEETPGRD